MKFLILISVLLLSLSSKIYACTWDSNLVSESTPLCVAKIETAWEIPTLREDGSALDISEIQAYRWYHIPPSGSETFSNLSSTTTTHSIDTSEVGNHIFSISTVDSSGTEGNRSPTITVNVPAGVPYPVFTRVILERCTASNECLRETVYQVQ